MKWLRRLLWAAMAFVLVLFAFSQAMAWFWGSDQEKISYDKNSYRFEAAREELSGVWQIKAPDDRSLWFAFGYLQAFDREFQTELVRLAARGEASRFFGEAVLKNDRLMRFSRRAAEAEFVRSPDFVKTSARAYVDGREALLSDPERMEPVEYQIMGVMRSSLPQWEASDVVAIARFHAWQLSFDANLEQLYWKLSEKIGIEKANLLLPSESSATRALYSQSKLFEGVSASSVLHRDVHSQGLPRSKTFVPTKEQAASFESFDKGSKFVASFAPAISFSKSIDFDWGTQLALRGASNLWVIADPRVGRELTLCNDTHLRFTWPSSLYPIRYQLESHSVRGTGFMLPGVPAMVVGSFEGFGEKNQGSQLSWGITLASYGDTQDLVLVDEKQKFVETVESYPIRDMETGHIEVRRLHETWTGFGPRVDTIFNEGPKPKGKAVALDWLGYGELQSPLEFFVRRNIFGSQNLIDDLHSRFPYPSFNFTWIERDAGRAPKIGHLVTGWLRGRNNRKEDGLRALRSEELSSKRSESQPRDRDYFLRNYEGRDPFFLVTANQKIWAGTNGAVLAHSWEPDERAQAIVEAFEQNAREPAFSQTDYKAPQLKAFLVSERRRNSADRLCAEAPLRGTQCLELLAKLDAWDANLLPEAWQPTLAALWHAYTKQEIFMGLISDDVKAEIKESAMDWHRRSFSSGAVQRILGDDETKARWEKLSGRSLSEVSLEAFRKSLRLLVEKRGPDTILWSWGDFHRIDWLHPLVKAPEPWGSVVHDSLLGPRPGVPGGLDSPGRFEYTWNEDKPLEFPASHGAALRMCTEFKADASLAMRWSAPTGPSGNPFSKYAKSWSFATFFKGLLSEVPKF